MQHVKSIMFFAGDREGHYLQHHAGAWVVRHRNFIDTGHEKTFSNIISALSELERASKIPTEMFTVGFPEMALVPILRTVG